MVTQGLRRSLWDRQAAKHGCVNGIHPGVWKEEAGNCRMLVCCCAGSQSSYGEAGEKR